jgi:hypothetical protein
MTWQMTWCLHGIGWIVWHLAYGTAIMWHEVHGHTFHVPNEDTYIPNENTWIPNEGTCLSQVFCWHGNIHFLEHDNPN